MPPLFSRIIIVLITSAVITTVVVVYYRPQISLQTDNITIKTPKVNFYIPSLNPIKVYKFDPSPQELKTIINENTKNSPATFGIFIKNLSTGQEVTLNPDERFNSASLYKLGVMYTLFQKQKEGRLVFNDDIQKNMKAMVTVSSNESSIYLVEKYSSWNEVNQTVKTLGLKDTNFYSAPLYTTPKDIAVLLTKISQGEAVDADSGLSMLKLLSQQKINDRIPVMIPSGVIVAHKTGELEDVRHDAGVLIGPDNNIVVVLMSKDSKYPEQVKPVMAKLAFEIYEFFRKQWSNPPEIL